jgi:hypothetical protein
MLTDDEIKALLEGCEGVTPGPWQMRQTETLGFYVTECADSANLVAADIVTFYNAAHIARCDPGTIAELCTRLLSAEARVRVLEDALRPFANADWIYQDEDDWAMAQSLGEDEVEIARTALQEQRK